MVTGVQLVNRLTDPRGGPTGWNSTIGVLADILASGKVSSLQIGTLTLMVDNNTSPPKIVDQTGSPVNKDQIRNALNGILGGSSRGRVLALIGAARTAVNEGSYEKVDIGGLVVADTTHNGDAQAFVTGQQGVATIFVPAAPEPVPPPVVVAPAPPLAPAPIPGGRPARAEVSGTRVSGADLTRIAGLARRVVGKGVSIQVDKYVIQKSSSGVAVLEWNGSGWVVSSTSVEVALSTYIAQDRRATLESVLRNMGDTSLSRAGDGQTAVTNVTDNNFSVDLYDLVEGYPTHRPPMTPAKGNIRGAVRGHVVQTNHSSATAPAPPPPAAPAPGAAEPRVAFETRGATNNEIWMVVQRDAAHGGPLEIRVDDNLSSEEKTQLETEGAYAFYREVVAGADETVSENERALWERRLQRLVDGTATVRGVTSDTDKAAIRAELVNALSRATHFRWVNADAAASHYTVIARTAAPANVNGDGAVSATYFTSHVPPGLRTFAEAFARRVTATPTGDLAGKFITAEQLAAFFLTAATLSQIAANDRNNLVPNTKDIDFAGLPLDDMTNLAKWMGGERVERGSTTATARARGRRRSSREDRDPTRDWPSDLYAGVMLVGDPDTRPGTGDLDRPIPLLSERTLDPIINPGGRSPEDISRAINHFERVMDDPSVSVNHRQVAFRLVMQLRQNLATRALEGATRDEAAAVAQYDAMRIQLQRPDADQLAANGFLQTDGTVLANTYRRDLALSYARLTGQDSTTTPPRYYRETASEIANAIPERARFAPPPEGEGGEAARSRINTREELVEAIRELFRTTPQLQEIQGLMTREVQRRGANGQTVTSTELVDDKLDEVIPRLEVIAALPSGHTGERNANLVPGDASAATPERAMARLLLAQAYARRAELQKTRAGRGPLGAEVAEGYRKAALAYRGAADDYAFLLQAAAPGDIASYQQRKIMALASLHQTAVQINLSAQDLPATQQRPYLRLAKQIEELVPADSWTDMWTTGFGRDSAPFTRAVILQRIGAGVLNTAMRQTRRREDAPAPEAPRASAARAGADFGGGGSGSSSNPDRPN